MNQNNEALVQSLCAIAECHSPISETREQLENSIRYALSHRPKGEAVAPVQWRRATKYGREYRDTAPTEKTRSTGWMPLFAAPPDTVPRSELEAANRLASSLLEIIGRISDALGISEEDQSVASGDEEILFAIAELQAKAVPEKKKLPDVYLADYHEAIGWNACIDAMLAAPAPAASPVVPEGYALVPIVASAAVLDRAVSFALKVSLSSEYTWSDYMRDLWAQMLSGADLSGGEV